MTVTISVVTASNLASLSETATQLQSKITELDTIIATQRRLLNDLADSWEGAAAGAAHHGVPGFGPLDHVTIGSQ